MKKLLNTILLLLFISTSTMSQDTMYIYNSNKSLHYFPLSNVDSMNINPLSAQNLEIHQTLGMSAYSTIDIDSITFTKDDSYIFKFPENIRYMIQGMYDYFAYDKSYRNRLCGGYVGNNTDIEYGNKSNGTADFNIYTMNSNSIDLTRANEHDPWGNLYRIICNANYAIKGIRQYTDTTNVTIAYLLGEALTLRSFCYLELTKYWGDVPINYNYYANYFEPKVDRNIIYEKIIHDLQDAEKLVPWAESCPSIAYSDTTLVKRLDISPLWLYSTSSYFSEILPGTTERVNKAYIKGLLAKTALMYAGKALRPDTWTGGAGGAYGVQYNVKDTNKRKELNALALNACADVIKHEPISKLQTSFKEIFTDVCSDIVAYNASESLFEIGFADTRGQVLNTSGIRSGNANTYLINTTSSSKSSSMTMVTPTFVYDFEIGDTRKKVTVAPFQWNKYTLVNADDQLKYPGSTIGETVLYPDMNDIDGFYLGKYRFEWMARATNYDDGVNLVLMRYADILLMFAEAAIGGISNDVPTNTTGLDGLTQLNLIRTRAGITSLATYNMNNIIKERAFEFCGENIRKYDLMRWGMLKSKLDETTTRIANLEAHSGEFAATADTVYYKYKRNDALAIGPTKGYEIDSIYGLSLGEIGEPSFYNTNNGWVKSNFFQNDVDRVLNPANYYLFGTGINVDYHQLWPIFDNNITASSGLLWNDYEY